MLKEYPSGGIVEAEGMIDPAVVDQMTLKVDIETFEQKDPPENIYNLPEGYKKGEQK